jgi:ParB-like chromosome segregation protein Spo0J
MVVELSRVEFGVSVALIKVRRSARVPVGTCANTGKRATNIKTTNLHPHQTRNNSTNMAPIDDALAALESREEGASFSFRQVAKKFGCSRTTLARRH